MSILAAWNTGLVRRAFVRLLVEQGESYKATDTKEVDLCGRG